MDNKSVNLFLKNIEENTRKVFSSSSYNESYYSSQKNCMPVTFKQEETSDEIQVLYYYFLHLNLFFYFIKQQLKNNILEYVNLIKLIKFYCLFFIILLYIVIFFSITLLNYAY